MERPIFKLSLFHQILLLMFTVLTVFVPFLTPALIAFGVLTIADVVNDGFQILADREASKPSRGS